jgi:hypothetical protein
MAKEDRRVRGEDNFKRAEPGLAKSKTPDCYLRGVKSDGLAGAEPSPLAARYDAKSRGRRS